MIKKEIKFVNSGGEKYKITNIEVNGIIDVCKLSS